MKPQPIPTRSHQVRPLAKALIALPFDLTLIVLLTVALLTSGCTTGPTQLISDKPKCCQKELSILPPLPTTSLYQVDSTWTNDRHSNLKLESLRGHPQVVTLFFASCEYACPILVHDMKRIEAALPPNLRTNVGFLLVSFDSERDTPQVLTNYRTNHALAGNWTLLRGEADDVLELAAILGVKFKKDSRGQFAHSNVITVLDKNGNIVQQQTGLNSRIDDVVTTLTRLH